MKPQIEKYTIEELCERSADFEELIDKLVELSDIPPRLRGISSERAKVDKILEKIHEIVRYNKRPYQNNVVEQNLFEL
jgi:hypothetical protein